jgi:hypothetical protein
MCRHGGSCSWLTVVKEAGTDSVRAPAVSTKAVTSTIIVETDPVASPKALKEFRTPGIFAALS